MSERSFSAGCGGFVVAYFIVAAIGATLGYYNIVPDPLTYWMWVGAIIFLAALGFAALKALKLIR
jgi:hypothetical protein